MLCLSYQPGDHIRIGEATVRFVRVDGTDGRRMWRIEIDAPPEVAVQRGRAIADRTVTPKRAMRLCETAMEFFTDEPTGDAMAAYEGLQRAAEWFASVHNAPIYEAEAPRD